MNYRILNGEKTNMRSVLLTLKIRYYTNLLFYLLTFFYGNLLMLYGNGREIGIKFGILVLLLHTLLMLCLGIQGEGIVRQAAPFNDRFYKRYRILFFMQILLYCFIGAVAQTQFSGIRVKSTALYLLEIICLFLSITLQKKILWEYNRISREENVVSEIEKFREISHKESKIDGIQLRKRFYYFIAYVLIAERFFEAILKSWILCILFLISSGYLLYKLFWEGIKELMPKPVKYYIAVVTIIIIGLITLKLNLEGIIKISLLNHRHIQEYYMVFVFFYLPLAIYGSKVVGLISKKTEWIK